MPSEKLVPYKIELYEKYDPEQKYDLSNLSSHDPSIGYDHIIDVVEDFLSNLEGRNLRDPSAEKTFIVEDFERNGNVIDGYISTGNYGYESLIRNVETGDPTYEKDEMEAEQLPFYFMFYLPQTVEGEPYRGGTRLVIILEQINRMGIKGQVKSRFEQFLTTSSDDTTVKFRPIYTERIYEKLLEADFLNRIDIDLNKIPGDDERRSELIHGIDSGDTKSQTIVLHPDDDFADGLREVVGRLKEEEREFAEVVSEEVEEVRAKVVNSGGRQETIPLMKNKVAMRRDLSGDELQYSNGLLTTGSLRREADGLFTDLMHSELVESPEFGDDIQPLEFDDEI
ncbi:hypothetical protein [Halapricum desulfuricans]|uniref:Uncharacterized protein n=1 Tax=Halapricum desulfuricans TaxID=2841257 RepID=A0A897NGZ3_9EURY|nr:hypothetical protein [Halapricum desulfuricans]QSG13720.1 hypothetical protein HSEST_0164 [Halapricum desulfuricans]